MYYEKHALEKTWVSMTKKLTNEKIIEKFMNKSNIRKQVDENNHEALKRMIVFNLKVKDDKNDREQVV